MKQNNDAGAVVMAGTSRRDFLKLVGVSSGGLILGLSLTGCGSSSPAIKAEAGVFSPNAFLQITKDSKIIFHLPRDEMGQGVYMGLSTLAAEELNTPPAEIDVVIVGAHKDYANPDMGVQITGGSNSMRVHYYQIRQAAANARQLILQAASEKLAVPVDSLEMAHAAVVHNGETYAIGEFAEAAGEQSLVVDAPLKPRAEFLYIGKELPRNDAIAKATGTALYGIDADVPNMHHAVVRHSPVSGGTAKSFNSEKAKSVPGVVDVLEIFSGVAVVADGFWPAKKAADLLEIEWDLPEPLSTTSSADIRADYQAALKNEEAHVFEETGSSSDRSDSDFVVDAEYWVPYLSHSPMEPMNAVVHIEGGSCEVWAGNQGPTAAVAMASRYGRVKPENVKVHGVFSGGGFGRRAFLTHVGEAAELAKETGLPIQVTWTRESDTRDGFFRPAGLLNVKAGVSKEGLMDSWNATRIGANITPLLLEYALPMAMPNVPGAVLNFASSVADTAMDGWVVDEVGVEGLYQDYDWPNKRIGHITKDPGIPTMFWRSVGHSYTAFAKECAVDELAHKAGLDPIEVRLKNCANNPRLANVIELANEVYAQGPSQAGRFLGFAAHGSFMSYVAQVAEVSIADGKIRVHKVTCVVDCGQVVNPSVVRDQMSGGIMFGLTAALHGNIEIENGRIKQGNFHDYPILRMNEAPSVDVIMVDSEEDPSGVGEPGVPPIAPAVANAVFAATGQRLREMPFRLS